MKFIPTLGGQYSGSMGGVTASRNRGGSYFRRRAMPVNPATSLQMAIRAAVGSLDQSWNTVLNDAQRESWRVYAANTERYDVLGQPIQLTGMQWFLGNNVPRMQAGLPEVLTAPSSYDTGNPFTGLTEFARDSTDAAVVGPIAGGASGSGYVLAYIGAPRNPGQQFFKGPYRFVSHSPVANGELSAGTGWEPATVGYEFAIGDRVPIRIRITYDDGRLSQPFAVIWTVTEIEP